MRGPFKNTARKADNGRTGPYFSPWLAAGAQKNALLLHALSKIPAARQSSIYGLYGGRT